MYHPDAGPWITSGYRFPWVMPLITKGLKKKIILKTNSFLTIDLNVKIDLSVQ